MSQPEAPLAIGESVDGRYRIVSEGAAGGCWRTYGAYDGQQDRLMVLTVLARRLGAEVSLLERVARANQAVQRLGTQPLVPYERAGLAGGQFYLVRRHLEGQSLRHRLDEVGVVEPEAALGLGARLCEALAPLHRAGLAHGGLSPDTIWLGAGEDAPMWIVDCGLLPALGPALAVPDRTRARFPYLAPEQAAGRQVHPSTDVYAIGLLLYEALAGRPPFDSGRSAVPGTWPEPVPLETRLPHVSPALAQTIDTALSREPSSRYRNAGQLAHLLRAQLQAPPAGPPSAAAVPTAPADPQLVVPPARRPRARRAGPVYYPEFEQERWTIDGARVDWLLVALIIAALVAVLGLIPLWRAVQGRYAPAPAPPGGSGIAPGLVIGPLSMSAPGMGASLLEIPGLLWYNSPVEAERECELEKSHRLHPNFGRGGNAVHVDLPVRHPPG